MQVWFRKLRREEIPGIWSIDRSEIIESVYRVQRGNLVLVDEYHDVRGWPPDEVERDTSMLLDCFDHGGSFIGGYLNSDLVCASVLESRPIGASEDKLQLKFLHSTRKHRGKGLGGSLFKQAAEKARGLGARKLYISATPSENTVRFYRSLGCHLATELDPILFKLEPDDIHMEFDLTG